MLSWCCPRQCCWATRASGCTAQVGGVAAALGLLASREGTAHMPPQRLQKVRVDVDMNLEELLVIM